MIHNLFQARIKSQVSNSYVTFCKNSMPKQQNCRNKIKNQPDTMKSQIKDDNKDKRRYQQTRVWSFCNSHYKKPSQTNLPFRIPINHNLHLGNHPNQVLLTHFRRGAKTITKKPRSLNMIKSCLLLLRQIQNKIK